MTRCALLGYHPWLNPGIDEPTETVLLPAGWVESSNPLYGLASATWTPVDFERYLALVPGQATDVARGFDAPDEHLRWFLKVAPHE